MKSLKPFLKTTSLLITISFAVLFGAVTVHAAKTHDFKGAASAAGAATIALAPAVVTGKEKESANADSGELTAAGQALTQFVSGMRDQVNAMLKGLPPLEQFETSQELSYGLRSIQSYANQLIEFANNVTTKINDITSKAVALAESGEARIKDSGLYVLKADAEAAQNSALDKLKQDMKAEFQAERQREVAVSARRNELSKDAEVTKTIPAAAIAHINAEVLAAEDYKNQLPKIKGRLDKISGAGVRVDVHNDFLAEMMALPLDEASEKVVDTRCESVKNLIAATASRGTGTASAAAQQPIPAGTGVETRTGTPRIF